MQAILSATLKQMVKISDQELEQFLSLSRVQTFKKQSLLSQAGKIPQEIFFINKGLIRVFILDNQGREHSLHFALEHQFIADYAHFIQEQPALYNLQALETTEVVVLPRTAITWGYENLEQGQKIGRLIAEFYFIYQDNRIKNTYAYTPKQRYDKLTETFPDIHNRVPQHMIASYLGISPVHLSRLKKETLGKKT